MKKSRKKFIKEAHEHACSEWKDKIEKEFPKLFTKEETYKIGDRFEIAGHTYLLASCGLNLVVLVNVTNGRRYGEQQVVNECLSITAKELDPFFKQRSIKKL